MRASIMAIALVVFAASGSWATPSTPDQDAGESAANGSSNPGTAATVTQRQPAKGATGSPGASKPLRLVLATQKLSDARPQLINGKIVKTRVEDWPAIVLTPVAVASSQGEQEGFCTGTLVGPGVILLAAHCLDQRTAQLRPALLTVDNITVSLKCEVDPDYLAPGEATDPGRPRHSQDFGLCYADTKNMASLTTFPFETLDTKTVGKGAAVLMMGYGCTDLDSSVRDQILRVGDATITTASGADGPDTAYARILSKGPPDPALCPGDSGGPLLTGATQEAQTLPRRVRGVNSSVQNVPQGLLSRIAMLSDPSFRPWAEKFIEKFPGAYICGLGDKPKDAKCHA